MAAMEKQNVDLRERHLVELNGSAAAQWGHGFD